MEGIGAYLIGAGIGLALKFIADISVRLSKRTENHIDDFLANSFKAVVGGFSFRLKK